MVFRLVCERHKVALRPNEAWVAQNETEGTPALYCANEAESDLYEWRLSPGHWQCPTDQDVFNAYWTKGALSDDDWEAYLEEVGANEYENDVCRDSWTVLDELYTHVYSDCINDENCPYKEENDTSFKDIFGREM